MAFFLTTYAFAQNNQLEITDKEEVTSLEPYLTVYATQDSLDGQQAFNQISQRALPTIAAKSNQGMIKNTGFWVRFDIKNKTEDGTFYIEVDNPQIDLIRFYELAEDNTVSLFYESGDHAPYATRPILHRNFIAPIQINKGETKRVLVNIEKRTSATRFAMEFYHEKMFDQKSGNDYIFYGIYFGFLALIILLALLVGIALRKQLFLWYALYITNFSLWLFSLEGFTYQFITSNSPYFNTHFFPATTHFTIQFLMVYIQSFFNTRNILPRFHRIISVFIGIMTVGFFVWITIPDQYMAFAPELFAVRYTLTLGAVVFAFTAAIKSIKTNPFKAKVFLFGYSLFFVGIICKILAEYGVINESLMLIDPIMVGFLIEILALSIAMTSILLSIIRHREKLLASNDQLQDSIDQLNQAKKNESPFLKLNSKAVLDIKKILYIKVEDHYLEFYLEDKDRPEIDRNKLSEILKVLPVEFAQIHRSVIVNFKHIKSLNGDQVMLKNGQELKMSRTYKKAIQERVL
ncbi:MAG: 7TM diverse intracellular signaling domain-containing protein [Cytophagales bacterium]|nr:7TM diverse intracellular signaling domain-containing protein [Cytophagales bacterium]